MRHLMITLVTVLLSMNIYGRNAIRAHSIYEMINKTEGNEIETQHSDRMRRDAIPSDVADLIGTSDTIYVMYYHDRDSIGNINYAREVWFFDDLYYDYFDYGKFCKVGDNSTVMLDEVKLLYGLVNNRFIRSDDITKEELTRVTVRRFVKISPTLYEFDRHFFYADFVNGVIYKDSKSSPKY